MLRLRPWRALGNSRNITTYAFLGLGRMGSHMARNLRAKIPPTDHLLLYDTIPASLAAFPASETTECVHHVQDMAAADVIVTMVPEGRHIREIYSPSKGIFSSSSSSSSSNEPGRERLLIDCSTIDPATSIEISRQCRHHGWGTFVDAPVSGGTKGAEAGSLSFMVGATPGSLSRLDDVLGMMGQKVHYCGAVGSGLAAKLCNNYLLALNNLATCEAMRMGLALGLRASVLGQVINSSTGKCWPSEKNNPVLGVTPGAPVERDYQGGFGIELMMKDLRLAIEAAEEANVELPSATAASDVYSTVARVNNGQYKGKDFGVVFQYLQDNAAAKSG